MLLIVGFRELRLKRGNLCLQSVIQPLLLAKLAAMSFKFAHCRLQRVNSGAQVGVLRRQAQILVLEIARLCQDAFVRFLLPFQLHFLLLDVIKSRLYALPV